MRQAMRAIRPDNRVSLRQKQGCVEVSSYSRHWPCLFPQHGPGKKHQQDQARWLAAELIVGRYPERLRPLGLFHSDGYRGLTGSGGSWGFTSGEHWYEYPRVSCS